MNLSKHVIEARKLFKSCTRIGERMSNLIGGCNCVGVEYRVENVI